MDGPYRTPQDHRMINRDSAARPAEESQQATKAAVYQAAARAQKRPSRRRPPLWILIALIVIVLGGGGYFAWTNFFAGAPGIDSTKYQAVFFTNGQVYFGKLQSRSGGYLDLKNVYYLQTKSSNASGNPQQTSSDQSDVQLIKLGNEIHGPEDEMVIAKDQVLFYENLKPNSKVVQSIATYQKSN